MDESRGDGARICRACGGPVEPDAEACAACGRREPSGGAQAPDGGVGAGADGAQAEAAAPFEEERPRIALGALFGAAGAVGAMAAWSAIIYFTGYEIGFAAWGVGAVIGFATLVGVRRGDAVMGVMAGALAVLAIVGGQVLVVRTHLDRMIHGEAELAYASQREFARKAVSAQDENQCRFVIAEMNSEEDIAPNPGSVTREELETFRVETQPAMKRFLDGTPSREECVGEIADVIRGNVEFMDVLKESVSAWTVLWLFLGVGTAFRIASSEWSDGGAAVRAQQRQAQRRRRRPQGGENAS